MSEMNNDPTPKELREFGLISGAIVIVLFALFLPWVFDNSIPLWPWIVAAVLALWALVAPASLIYIYRPWLKFGAIMGFINTRIILGAVFFLIITPVGWFIRILGKKLLEKSEPGAQSYRVASDKPNKQHMENPY